VQDVNNEKKSSEGNKKVIELSQSEKGAKKEEIS
jgi:hypothetical protein